ncbi:MAG: DnaD domain protein [Lachnospiraceae bacterium]
MGKISINNPLANEVTLITNTFLDTYMPKAYGEFVKVYLYLLRSSASFSSTCTLSSIADALNCTEGDIRRALSYWEKEKVLSLSFDADNRLKDLHFLPLQPQTTRSAAVAAAPEAPAEDTPAAPSKKGTAAEPVPAASTPVRSRTPQTLTVEQIETLKQKDDVIQFLYIAEQYLGSTLRPNEAQRLLFYYEDLHFSGELIEYLIEYCVSRGCKSMHYINEVALRWHEDGITSIEMAKEKNALYNETYYTILKALGIKSRNPVKSEIALMDRWTKEYGFSLAIIVEACNRTVLQTGQPSLQYASKILQQWKESGLQHFEDIAKLDAAFKEKKAQKKPAAPKRTAQNRFQNYNHREYDFDELNKHVHNQ